LLVGWFLLFSETGSHHVAQAGLEPVILLPVHPEGWDYRCAPVMTSLPLFCNILVNKLG
jgi:hypothetical protein